MQKEVIGKERGDEKSKGYRLSIQAKESGNLYPMVMEKNP